MSFKVSDICNTNKNNLSTKDNLDFINYLDTSNLTEGIIDNLQKLIIGEDKLPSRAKRKVEKNDILISTVRPNQKHYGIIKKIEENLIASTGFSVLSAKEDLVDSEYLQAVAETSTSAYHLLLFKSLSQKMAKCHHLRIEEMLSSLQMKRIEVSMV